METNSHKYDKLQNIAIHACKILQKKRICLKRGPAKSAMSIYASTHSVETVKWLDYNRYSQLTQWCSGNASASGSGKGFDV